MIGVSVHSTITEARAEFRALREGIFSKAVPRALNRALDQAATEANRQIRRVYNVRAKAVSSAMKKKRAHARQAVQAATLELRGARLGLIEFDARQTRAGVTVRIKRGAGRTLVRGAFITTLASGANAGYRGVFVRESKDRYPIRALKSITVPQAFLNEAVLKAVNHVAAESFRKNLAQQIRFLSRPRG